MKRVFAAVIRGATPDRGGVIAISCCGMTTPVMQKRSA